MTSGDSSTALRLMRRLFAPDECSRLARACAALPLHFEHGRQGTGYTKADLIGIVDPIVVEAVGKLRTLLGDPIGFDAWWLVYPPGSHIPTHTDPPLADGFAHVRLNVLIEGGVGGAFVASCTNLELDVGDAVLFRPDVVAHAVGLVKERARRVLSVGTGLPIADVDACLNASVVGRG
jgi:hypothetical protein